MKTYANTDTDMYLTYTTLSLPVTITACGAHSKGCPPGQECVDTGVRCVRAPCPEAQECRDVSTGKVLCFQHGWILYLFDLFIDFYWEHPKLHLNKL